MHEQIWLKTVLFKLVVILLCYKVGIITLLAIVIFWIINNPKTLFIRETSGPRSGGFLRQRILIAMAIHRGNLGSVLGTPPQEHAFRENLSHFVNKNKKILTKILP
uniref:Uncharacterized protein n=1 Tax=Cacopsylla melanoneura TaxID=428564 RepID=A0A8D8VX01_9HEMI